MTVAGLKPTGHGMEAADPLLYQATSGHQGRRKLICKHCVRCSQWTSTDLSATSYTLQNAHFISGTFALMYLHRNYSGRMKTF